MNNQNVLQHIQQMLLELMQNKDNVFIHDGMLILGALGAIVFVLHGVTCALNHHMDFAGTFQKILLISVPYAMLAYWTTPAPIWGGYSFPEMIASGSLYFANQVGQGDYEAFIKALDDWLHAHPFSLVFGPGDLGGAIIAWLCVVLLEWALMFVMAWGFVAQSVLILIGPLFVPFLVFDSLSFLFWGWLKSFIQYSFYPLIAAIVVHVMGTLAINALASLGGAIVVPILLLSIFALFSTGSLVSHIFSGSSGAGSGAGAIAAAVVRKGF